MHSALQNQFLRSLSPESREAILQRCTPQAFAVGTILYRPDEALRYAYFLTSGIASVVLSMRNGDTAEVAFIGKEGLTGSMQLIGPSSIRTSCFTQLPATALRIHAADLKAMFDSCEEVHDRILEFAQYQCAFLSQMCGCNRLHEARARLARWLLMAQDRTDSATLNFTQEFLGEMLCLKRTTVTAIAIALQREGMITYSRGRLVISNRAELERQACECYSVERKLSQHLYSRAWLPRRNVREPL